MQVSFPFVQTNSSLCSMITFIISHGKAQPYHLYKCLLDISALFINLIQQNTLTYQVSRFEWPRASHPVSQSPLHSTCCKEVSNQCQTQTLTTPLFSWHFFYIVPSCPWCCHFLDKSCGTLLSLSLAMLFCCHHCHCPICCVPFQPPHLSTWSR